MTTSAIFGVRSGAERFAVGWPRFVGLLFGAVIFALPLGCAPVPDAEHALHISAPKECRGSTVSFDGENLGALGLTYHSLLDKLFGTSAGEELSHLTANLAPLLTGSTRHTVQISGGRCSPGEFAFNVEPNNPPQHIELFLAANGKIVATILYTDKELRSFIPPDFDPTPNPSLQRTPPG